MIATSSFVSVLHARTHAPAEIPSPIDETMPPRDCESLSPLATSCACRNVSFFPTFPMLVPSLSW